LFVLLDSIETAWLLIFSAKVMLLFLLKL